MCGTLATGSEAVLCHYTYEVRHTSSDGNGGSDTSWESFDFTVVETDVTCPDIGRLTLHPRSFGDNRLFDSIDSALTSDRVVQLESAELEHEYKLEVHDSASELAVRLLFEPAFMVWCLDQAADEMLIEIENETLVVAIPDHSYDASQLDALVERADDHRHPRGRRELRERSGMSTALIVLIAVLLLLALWAVITYNRPRSAPATWSTRVGAGSTCSSSAATI